MVTGPEKSLTDSAGNWIFGNLRHFSIVDYYDSQRLIDLIKPMGELVLACCLLKKFETPFFAGKANDYIIDAWKELREGEILREIITIRPDLLVMCGVYASFKINGLINPRLEAEIKKISDTPGFFMQDWPAWRRLDLLHGLHALGLKHSLDIHDTFSKTWLYGCFPPWTLTDGTAYGVTHTIFYMTDYGSDPEGCGKQVTKYLLSALPLWVSHYIEEKNYDLASEMIMAMCCVGMAAMTSNHVKAISLMGLEDGAITGPDFGSATLLHGEKDSGRRYFLHHYHTTLVALMGAAMSDYYLR